MSTAPGAELVAIFRTSRNRQGIGDMKARQIWLLGIAGVVVLWMALIVGFFDWNWLRRPLNSLGASQSGRSFSVERVEGEWSLRPRVRIEGVRLGNADWADGDDMLAAERIDFIIDLPELLKGRIVVPELRLVRPKLDMQRLPDGRSNWSFGTRLVADAALPDDRDEVPLIGRLSIEGGELNYRDQIAGLDIKGEIGTAKGQGGSGRAPVEFQGQGTLQGERFEMKLVGGSLLSLREGNAPYPLTADIAVGATLAHVSGTLADPVRFEGLALDIRLRGPNLGELAKLTGVPLPMTPPYDLKARLDRKADVWLLENLTGRMGHSDLAGLIRIDTGKPRLFIDADLRSRVLDYRDVGALIGIPPGDAPAARRPAAGGAPAAPRRVLPDAPLMVEQVRHVDARVRFRGAKVEAPNTPLEAVDLTLDLRDGVLKMAPLALGIAGGRAIATVEIDARTDVVRTDFDVRLAEFRLERFLAAVGFPDAGQGRIDGRVRLVGRGDSVRKALATANGDIRLAMSDGSMSSLALELVGLDVADALGLVVAGDRNTAIRCLIGDVVVANGVVSPRLLMLDTDVTVVTVEGNANLGKESLDLRMLSHPKSASLLSARSPIRIGGHFSDASVGIELLPLGARIAGATLLGALLTPLAAFLAFLDPGLAVDSDCARLLDENRTR